MGATSTKQIARVLPLPILLFVPGFLVCVVHRHRHVVATSGFLTLDVGKWPESRLPFYSRVSKYRNCAAWRPRGRGPVLPCTLSVKSIRSY